MGFSPSEISLRRVLNEILEKLNRIFNGKIRLIQKRIKEITILGVKITFSTDEPSEGLTQVIERVIKKKKIF